VDCKDILMAEIVERKITKKEIERQKKIEFNKKWKETRERVIARDGGGCVICGSKLQLNVHHIIPREVEEYFFDENNLITLCLRHHKYGSPKTFLSAHKNVFPFIVWLMEDYILIQYLDGIKYIERFIN